MKFSDPVPDAPIESLLLSFFLFFKTPPLSGQSSASWLVNENGEWKQASAASGVTAEQNTLHLKKESVDELAHRPGILFEEIRICADRPDHPGPA